jgi:hypothetical protein
MHTKCNYTVLKVSNKYQRINHLTYNLSFIFEFADDGVDEWLNLSDQSKKKTIDKAHKYKQS